jgi:plasmid stability protein
MKQLLLRVDDGLHARLREQATAAGKSVNALANEILCLGIDPANLSRRDRLQLRLMAVGEVGRGNRRSSAASAQSLTPANLAAVRARALDAVRGIGPMADQLLDYERGER